ncbi:NAD binding site:D-amino acid oxidase [Cyanobium sp. PCC 7001]|uniref:NAD(P)/FAD-dependent oxidoreductase n=1 Tax=Cyanobium sp. PCC 7001 TaxID=180281 RepID=UPI0001805D59|nr:FAD-dependent oxidoreductase [Cyanobium sp. PCC 7001]EDY38995.1 NAD binding site:D-amino acid oxidase [Cyanobium sp. PCC 7001]
MKVVVVGAGIVGLSCAWLLQRRGHSVLLVDPALEPSAGDDATGAETGATPPEPRSGSRAALGVLMAQMFHRSRGRAWRLRQRSLALWQRWILQLEGQGHRLPRREGLLWLAADDDERLRQQHLVQERQAMGLPLEWWGPERLAALTPSVPADAIGGLVSPRDGQLDPEAAVAALLADARAAGLEGLPQRVVAIRRQGSGRWRLVGEDGEPLADTPWLVLTAGLASTDLLQDLGHPMPMSPVLGQAVQLRLTAPPSWTWPGVVVWRGRNLVPRPDRPGGRDLWLGATLEPGAAADPGALAELLGWGTAGLDWLATARVERHWQGLRARPEGRPAPVLEQLEPGLLVAGGHYRNGVLLAPASAEWVVDQVEASGEPR